MFERRTQRAFRHAVITGASSGLGAALARQYARSSGVLSLLGRDSVRLNTVTQQCIAAGAQVFPQTGNVTDAPFIASWIEGCDARTPVDLVIANAGVGGRFAMPETPGETVEVANEIFAANLIGVANTILPILPHLVQRGRGHVVLLSSLAAFIGLADAPAYSASKAAVRVYGHALRRLLSRHGVRVSVVCPGFVRTPMSDSIPGKLPLLWECDRAAAYISKRIALGHREIAFPWPLATLARLAAMLPSSMVDAALDRVRRSRRNA